MSTLTVNGTKVAVGQVWRDRDPRNYPKRTFTINSIWGFGDGTYAYYTNARGEERYIRVDRLRPIGETKGYELVRDAR